MLRPPEDWTIPPLTLAIAGLQRTGTHFLAEAMDSTGLLGRPDEYFKPLPRTHLESCREAAVKGRSANGVVAIQFFPEHFAAFNKQGRFSDWFGSPRWIWLQRRDLLDQAISMVIATQTAKWNSRQASQVEARYSPRAIGHHIRRFAQRDAYWAEYFARTGISPLRIVFEELVEAPDIAVRRIAEVAGIEIVPGSRAPADGLRRQASSLNHVWRTRYIESHGDPNFLDVPGRFSRDGTLGVARGRARSMWRRIRKFSAR